MPHDYTPEIEAAFAAFEVRRVKRVELPPLRFERGPYFPPQVEIGDEIECALYGTVRVVGWSQGPLPWPQCHISGPRSLILFGDLVRAVGVESCLAVAVAWGVSGFSVHKWRQALEIERVNAGSKARWSSNFSKVISRAQNDRGLELAHARETRVKAEATKNKNGKMRHQWTPEQIAQMGVLSDAVIGASAGCDARTVESERKRRGIVCKGAGGKQQGAKRLDGARVQARRWQLGLTQSDVGALFGCGCCRISRLEKERGGRVTDATLKRLAGALSCSPESLLATDD